jgi:hypothetical protein
MSAEHLFETETMAELCAKQGRLAEALAILRRLIDEAPASPARERWQRRARDLERRLAVPDAAAAPADVPIPEAPGVSVAAAEDAATVAWALPPGTPGAALEIVLIQRGPAGVETTRRLVPLAEPAGRLAVPAPGLHSALAAVGRHDGERFVPLARTKRA